nr:VanW family protein [Eubacterium sp.]
MQKRGRVAVVVILFLFAIIVAYVLISYNKIKPEENQICQGIKVDTIDIGGMTRDEAGHAVNAYISQKGEQKVQIDVNGQKVATTLQELGYIYAVQDFLDEAMSVGRDGNMIENYKEIQKASTGKIVYPVDRTLDEAVLKKFVKKNCKSLCTKAQNASIKLKNGAFVYGESKTGISLSVKETMQMIKDAVAASPDSTTPISVVANVTVEEPEISKETATRCKDKIGTYSTTFNAGNTNRTKNLGNAARLISGTVVYPGETFSVHDTISPLTEENGYYAAASYNNGKVEDSLGGGVCQVSTTLYNAVLRAELEIVERSPHSMVVSYVKPAMDAAIAGDYKDFKFKNNTEVPIYIQGGTYGGTIYFDIYGEETRSANRKVVFESEITQTIQPGADKVTLDKTKPESYFSVTQEAHIGYKAILWKIVTENGKETKTQINSSSYSASPRYVVKGAKKEEKKPAATKKPADAKKSATEKKTTSNGNASQAGASNNASSSTPAPAPAQDGTEATQ